MVEMIINNTRIDKITRKSLNKNAPGSWRTL